MAGPYVGRPRRQPGISVCAPIHDALSIEATELEIDEAVQACQLAMREASEIVLGGFPLRTDVKIVHYPNRYMDARGRQFWELVCFIEGEELSAIQLPVYKDCPLRS